MAVEPAQQTGHLAGRLGGVGHQRQSGPYEVLAPLAVGQLGQGKAVGIGGQREECFTDRSHAWRRQVDASDPSGPALSGFTRRSRQPAAQQCILENLKAALDRGARHAAFARDGGGIHQLRIGQRRDIQEFMMTIQSGNSGVAAHLAGAQLAKGTAGCVRHRRRRYTVTTR